MLESSEDLARALQGDGEDALPDCKVARAERDHVVATYRGVTLGLLWPEVWGQDERMAELRASQPEVDAWLCCGSPDEVAGDVPWALGVLAMPASARDVASAMRMSAQVVQKTRELEARIGRLEAENNRLTEIGRALGRERDTEALLDLILTKAREGTGADAGSIYVVEGIDEACPRLRFVESQNDSRVMPSQGFELPVSNASIVGACVLRAEAINIADLYKLDAPGTGNNSWGFVHDRSLDRRYEYQTRSLLTIPLISARLQVIGVVQLINRRAPGVKRLDSDEQFGRDVRPFDENCENFANALASQAGIALENALLYEEVRTLFEGFVRASVSAIEARDPTTSGHSMRVADLTVGLAKAVDRAGLPAMAGRSFTNDELREIEYAALLHDFGKVGVREHVLVKAAKLYSHQRDLIEQRFEFIRRSLEVEHLAGKVKYLMDASREETTEQWRQFDSDAAGRIKEIDEFMMFIMQANQPTLLEERGFERIEEIAARTYLDRHGLLQPYLHPEEVRALKIARGSLTEDERREIEGHVIYTEAFLQKIPWGRAFRSIPAIAAAHHEKIDGTGYPRGLAGEAIPLPARMMTITDIYDALTASDRPYKKAVPAERALDILGDEVKRGKLDTELYRVFVESKVYDLVK